MVKDYTPERGDFVWINFNPQSGHEQRGKRPALILSDLSYNEVSGLCLACPVTKQKKGYPFEVEIPSDSDVAGVVLSDHVKSLDWKARDISFICKADDEIIEEVSAKLTRLISKEE